MTCFFLLLSDSHDTTTRRAFFASHCFTENGASAMVYSPLEGAFYIAVGTLFRSLMSYITTCILERVPAQ